MNGFGECPRCGKWSLEHLGTHSHCWECNYFPEENEALDEWARLEFRKTRKGSTKKASTCPLEWTSLLHLAGMRTIL